MTPVQIAVFLAAASCSVIAVPSGNHTCTGVTKIPVTVLVNVTVPVTFRSYTWCLRVPPRCSKYTVQLRDRVQLHTEMHNKTITVCCRGFVEMDGRCVPACPEGADCPFMRCNRTNHCYCTPGYTGLYCNDPCPRGVWGKDCKRPCDCPSGYTCHHLTGDCMVDDRPSRKSTTTTVAPTTTRAATTAIITTEGTTLETVKTPQFRFPPPPWVEAAGSTTPRKQTTRIIRDEFTTPTTQKMTEEFTTRATPVTTVVKTFKPFVEFFTPPKESSTTTVQTTTPTTQSTMYIKEKKEEYLPSSSHTLPTTITLPTTVTTASTTLPTTVTTPTTTAEPSTVEPTTPTTTLATTTPPEVFTTPTTFTTTQPNVITPSTTTPSTTTPSTVATIPTREATTPSTTLTTVATTPSTETTTLTTPSTTTPKTVATTPTTETTTPTTVTTEPTTPLIVTTQTIVRNTLPSTVLTTETIKETEIPLEVPTFVVKTIPPIETITTPTTISTTQEVTYQTEKTHISPEFKVIKVIKTDNTQPKQPKFPTTKEQTPLELDNRSLDNKFDTKEPTSTNIKSNVRTKVKKDGSPIIYISPTSKDIHEILTTNEAPFTNVPETSRIPLTTILTTLKKDDGNTVENEIRLKETLTTIETTTTTEQQNKSLLHSLFSGTKYPIHIDLNKPSSGDEQESQMKEIQLSPETHLTSTSTHIEETKLTTLLNKKKTKDYSQKKTEDKSETKIFKKVTLEGSLTTLSPIHLLKQLLNATSKPRTTTTVLPSSENLPPSAYIDDFTKEILNKKSKYDDLIIPFSASEKGKKKHDKSKQKHSKDGKEHSFVTPIKPEKQPDIPIPPLTTTSTTEMAEKSTIAATEIVTSTAKPTEQIVTVLDKSIISNVQPQQTTHSPNLIYRDTHTTRVKEYVRNENDKMLTTENNVAVTDNNNIVESNTIDTLRTSLEAMPKKGLEEEQEDSNYSIIHNKMKLVKSETLYGAAGMTGAIPSSNSVTAMLMTVGIAVLTLVALAGTLWVYMRRRQRAQTGIHPRIMAYELPEPTPIDVQSLEQTFFCPTFTNNYAEKINRELRELSYDHPRSILPEPLYAEIRY